MKRVTVYLSLVLLFLFVGLSSVNAGFEEGLAAYYRGDYETAFKEFKPLAEQGDAKSQIQLGLMYVLGEGIPKNYAEAFKWSKKAAEQGDADAQSLLGSLYGNGGEGVPKNDAEAFKWYKMAAEQGIPEAQFSLGWMYDMGHGVPRDYVMAYMLYNLAAAQGLEDAISNRSVIENVMTPQQIAKAERLSSEFKVKSP